MTLADRVGVLEQQVADNHSALQSDIEALRIDVQRLQSDLKDKFDLMFRSWEAQEREIAEVSPESTLFPVIQHKSEGAGSIMERNGRGGDRQISAAHRKELPAPEEERERKGKERTASPETTHASELPPQSDEIWVNRCEQDRPKLTIEDWKSIILPLPPPEEEKESGNGPNHEKNHGKIMDFLELDCDRKSGPIQPQGLGLIREQAQRKEDITDFMKLAQRISSNQMVHKKAQINSGPNRSKVHIPSPTIKFDSHSFPHQTTYVPSPTPVVVPNTTAVTVLPPTPMEKGPPIKRINETQVSMESRVKAFQKKGEIEETGTEIPSITVQTVEASVSTETKRGREEHGPVDNRDRKLFESLTGIRPSIGGKEQAFLSPSSGEKRSEHFLEISPKSEIIWDGIDGWNCKDYRRLFNRLAASFSTLPETSMVCNFANGFQTILQPQGLGLLLKLAQRLEDKNGLSKHAQMIYSPYKNRKKLPSPNSSMVFIDVTGYGICMDKILLVDGRSSGRKLTPEMVELNENSNFKVETHLHLEDKVDFEAAGNDRNWFLSVCSEQCVVWKSAVWTS